MNKIDIFYADDDEDDLMFFNDAVSKITANISTFINLHIHRNGEELIENIKSKNVKNGVAFLDINMPRKSGFELLEEIRSQPEIGQFPVIMYSTSSDQSNILKSQELGANFYAVKPYDFQDLIKMISTFIEINWESHKADLNHFVYHKLIN